MNRVLTRSVPFSLDAVLARTGVTLAAVLAAAAQMSAAEATTPVVELVAPSGPVVGQTTFLALACNEDIREVGFWVDGRFAGADDSPPFELTADLGAELKPHTVRALAIDRHKVVVGETSLDVNQPESGLIAGVKRGAAGVNVVASPPPGAARPVSYQLFAADRRLASWEQPELDLTLPYNRLDGVDVLRLSAEYDDGSRLDRYLLLRDGYTERVDVNEVQLWVTVTDRRGQPVLDLEPEAFAVTGPGIEAEPPPVLRPGEQPLTLAVVLDRSDSMDTYRKTARRATETVATEFLWERDRLLLFDVADRPRLLNPGGDPSDAVVMLEELAPGGGSAIADSLYFAVRRLQGVDGRKALILVSDGADLHSHLETERVAEAAWETGVPVFLISGGMPSDALSRLRAFKLRRFVEATGGRAFYSGSVRGQERAFETILELVRNPYVMPLTATADWDLARLREVSVELEDPDLEARIFLGRDG